MAVGGPVSAVAIGPLTLLACASAVTTAIVGMGGCIDSEGTRMDGGGEGATAIRWSGGVVGAVGAADTAAVAETEPESGAVVVDPIAGSAAGGVAVPGAV
jgi:hypothetical protein